MSTVDPGVWTVDVDNKPDMTPTGAHCCRPMNDQSTSLRGKG